jgi:hypothetical protein
VIVKWRKKEKREDELEVEWLTDADCDAALFEELNDSALVISDI